MPAIIGIAAKPVPLLPYVLPKAPSQIAQTAQRKLRASAYPQLWQVDCAERDGTLTLAGNVTSFYLKQVAQATVGRLDGVNRIVNQIEVSD